MIVENVNIYNLVPIQIAEMIEKLKSALEVVKNRKQTISKVASFEKENLHCPYCNSSSIVKNGHTKTGVQTYKCKYCCKRFNDLTGTIFEKSHLTYSQIEIFIQCFKDKVSLRKTAKRMGVGKDTVHLLRLKLIDSFKKARENIKLSGVIECDEIYRSINLKGTKPENMPRYSKPRTSSGTATRGINKHKVCIETAVSENDVMFLEIVGTGPITSEMVNKSLVPKLEKVTKLITDCKSSYESVAKNNEWNLIQIKSKTYIDVDGNSLANINSIQSNLSTFMANFRGVSTKHLQGYLDWFCFEKYLNYSFEEIKQINEIIKLSMSNSTEINTNNIYGNHCGIDFNEIYSDYCFTPSRTN